MKNIIIALFLLFCITSCGQTGKLYLPPEDTVNHDNQTHH